MGLLLQIEKTVHGLEAHRLSSKENIPGALVSKEVYADSILGHERTHHYWFSFKKYNCE